MTGLVGSSLLPCGLTFGIKRLQPANHLLSENKTKQNKTEQQQQQQQ